MSTSPSGSTARAEPPEESTQSFTDTLPAVLVDALTTLRAPQFETAASFLAWAETRMQMICRCGEHDGREVVPVTRTTQTSAGPRQSHYQITRRTSPSTMGKRHTFRINPHTGVSSVVASTDRAREAVEAEHFLWALTHPTVLYRCAVLAQALTSVGTGPTTFPNGQKKRMLAMRTVICAVQYLDTGHDLHEFAWWLAMGANGPLLTRLREAEVEGVATWDELETLFEQTSEVGLMTSEMATALLSSPMPV